MLDECIPKEISSRIVIVNQDSRECERYKVNLNTNSNENNLQPALETAEIENTGLLSGYIYIDVNKARQNLYMKLISAITIFKSLQQQLTMQVN